MPASFTIDEKQRLVRSRAWGVLVDQDLRSNQQALRNDSRFDPTFRQVYDFTGVTDVQLTQAGIQSLAYNPLFVPTARRAVVVSSDVAYGMARMYALISNRDERAFRIFRDLDSAQRWIELDTDDPSLK